MLKNHPFIHPSAPVLKSAPPTGPDWLHEVKFDGWRAQLHKDGEAVAVYSRNGRNMSKQFPFVRDSLIMLPAHTSIIDAEIVVCDSDGRPDFNALMRGETANLCAWCFDLIELNDRDLRSEPLVERKALLRDLLIEADDHVLRYSSEWADPQALLIGAERFGLEGIVSKRKDQRYVSGKNSGWVKVNCPTWRELHKSRGELFASKGFTPKNTPSGRG